MVLLFLGRSWTDFLWHGNDSTTRKRCFLIIYIWDAGGKSWLGKIWKFVQVVLQQQLEPGWCQLFGVYNVSTSEIKRCFKAWQYGNLLSRCDNSVTMFVCLFLCVMADNDKMWASSVEDVKWSAADLCPIRLSSPWLTCFGLFSFTLAFSLSAWL